MTTIETPRPKQTPLEGHPPGAASPNPTKRLRRDEIVDEATRLFAERGYEGASMADLAERVGLRKASLFHHFASKDVLYAAVLERLIVPVTEAISRALRADGSFVDRVDVLSDAITEVLWEQPFAARLIVREAMDWGPVVRGNLKSSIHQMLEEADSFVRAGQDAGMFVEGDTRHLIMSIIGVHCMPFLVPNITDAFLGTCPYEKPFLETRRRAVREHVRSVMVKRKK